MNAEELRILLRDRPLLLDGGLGSRLIAMGLPSGRAPEWWNLEHPGRLAEVHRSYAQAGSDIVHANTFGCTPPKLRQSGLDGRCREVCSRGIEIARGAVGSSSLVAGDIGPTGLMLPPVGTASLQEMKEAFVEQAAVLAEAGADLLSIETMYDLREALAAVEAARATGLPVIASMTFDARRRGFFTIMGDPLASSLSALAQAGADAVGFNCTVTSDVMRGMVEEAVRATDTPIAAQPNAGQPRPAPGGVVYDASPDAFARDLGWMVEAGARLVGGCCGTDADFIRAARAVLDAGRR